MRRFALLTLERNDVFVAMGLRYTECMMKIVNGPTPGDPSASGAEPSGH